MTGIGFFKKQNRNGETTTRPLTPRNNNKPLLAPLSVFKMNDPQKRPIIRDKFGNEVVIIGSGRVTVNGKSMSLEELKKSNPELYNRVMKIASRMESVQQALGRNVQTNDLEAVVGFKKL